MFYRSPRQIGVERQMSLQKSYHEEHVCGLGDVFFKEELKNIMVAKRNRLLRNTSRTNAGEGTTERLRFQMDFS